MIDSPTPYARAARLYRRLRAGDRLSARAIAALVGFSRVDSAHRIMVVLEREDADLVRDATIDVETERPIFVWYLRQTRETRG